MPASTATAASFFVLRTPGLPVEFQAGLGRARLMEAVRRPEIREALFVASPDLEGMLDPWLRGELTPERALRVDRSLVRYLTRMSTRPTPFGLFAGCATGAWGEASRLEVPPLEACARRTRLDMDYLAALVADLEREPAVRALLAYRPNTSLHMAAGRWHFAEPRVGAAGREYHLVAVEPTRHLDATLAIAAGGAPLDALAASLARDEDVEPLEARAFLEELVDGRLLEGDLEPPLTGCEPLPALARRLEAGADTRSLGARLEEVHGMLGDLDAAGTGQSPERYRAIARTLAELAVPMDPARLFQVDLHKPGPQPTLGPKVRRALEEAVELLRRLTPPRPRSALDAFKDAFRERYDTRSVPLLEALDAEAGIGFGPVPPPGLDGSPLLQGLPFPAAGPADPPFTNRDAYILKRLHFLGEAREWALDDADLVALADPSPQPFPDSFAALAALASPSPEALAQGRFQVLAENYSGPSGAQLLGRFCQGDPLLAGRVEELLLQEEARRPETVFAEIVHQPDGRIGNILARPRLRPFEIPFLGVSGAPEACRIEPCDLRISLRADRLVLHSTRMGREVVPRLASAQNYAVGLPAFRFLAQLQEQDGRSGGWSWGPLSALPFLPRVTRGRHVLSRARWVIEAAELGGPFEAVRARRRLPRHVVLQESDNALWVDLDDPARVAALLHLVERQPSFTLREAFPGPGELAAAGPAGHYTHELVVPFRNAASAAPPRRAPAPALGLARAHPPGSSWLYLKIYAGPAAADRILVDLVTVLRKVTVQAWDRWFFVRYADPEPHLRLRFHGVPAQLTSNLLPLVRRILRPFFDSGACRRLQVDTYEPELERYGGPEGMPLAEAWFEEDSDQALELLRECEGDEGGGRRWQHAFRGADAILSDLGLGLAARLRVVEAIRKGLGREFQAEGPLAVQLGERYRILRGDLEAWAPGRSHGRRSCLSHLAAAADEGRLTTPLENLASSLVHMHVNRALRTSHRAHELVLADFLARVYRSQLARLGS